MTGGARRFGRRCRHDYELAEAHHHEVEQQPRQQQAAEQRPAERTDSPAGTADHSHQDPAHS
ncbi:hypothetical protein [Amycolatopsis sp. 195334CR]|uniref:hypothetical protein n=1 Tax=Amycolatopsis sp. 195334CR TaxID=2814588 RepID=UPI001A8F0B7A|nr:hypothetical protein [Amycolatopsis sp. 195334CR]MBN6035015.1 hypothetical protein [Amycolatopsis sp. 195334CR]